MDAYDPPEQPGDDCPDHGPIQPGQDCDKC